MKRTIFITGASGMIGQELLRIFLDKTTAHIIALVHDNPLRIRSSRVTEVRGDITRDELGLEKEISDRLKESATDIIHAAALTRFDATLTDARKINVLGTKSIADFAVECRALTRFGYISTAYVSGRRKGVIAEDELEHAEGFVNTYEQSKYEAEVLLSDYKHRFPIAIYRLSTVMGNSASGHVAVFNAVHKALRMMYIGLAPMLPGTAEFRTDFLTSDHAARAIYEIFWKNFEEKTYHITQCKTKMTIGQIIDMTYMIFGQIDPAWKKKQFPKPAIVDQKTFELFRQSAIAAENIVFTNLLQMVSSFAYQLLYPKNFDMTNTLSAYPSYRRDEPDMDEFYRMMVTHCCKTKWGKVRIDGR